MKRIVLLVLIIFCGIIPLFSQIVTIPDTNFLHTLIDEGVDINGDSLISYAEAEAVTHLNIIDAEFSDMTGIKAFVNLDSLYIDYCLELTSLNLSNIISLKYLAFACCYNLKSLDVSSCIALKELQLSGGLTSLDVSNNIGLTQLHIPGIPTLYEVCVWTLPFPPEGVYINKVGSPNVDFTTECTTGVGEQQFDIISVYPNPANDQLTIETEQSGYHTIEITSLNGQLIYSATMQGDTLRIDMSPFSKGVYLIKIRFKEFVTTRKVIRL